MRPPGDLPPLAGTYEIPASKVCSNLLIFFVEFSIIYPHDLQKCSLFSPPLEAAKLEILMLLMCHVACSRKFPV